MSKKPFPTLKAISSAIEKMKLPYDYKKTAATLDKASKKTQSRLAAIRKAKGNKDK